MSECREYQGCRHPFGYGYPAIGEQRYKATGGKDGRRQVLLHRWVMEQMVGRKLERHEVVRHTCDNPPCFLFEHLRLGTQDDNVGDMVERGRSNRGERHWNWKGGHSRNYREGNNLRKPVMSALAPAGYAGYRAHTRARTTGTLVVLCESEEQGIPASDGGRWLVICEGRHDRRLVRVGPIHAGSLNCDRLKDARALIHHPDDWCPYCQGIEPEDDI